MQSPLSLLARGQESGRAIRLEVRSAALFQMNPPEIKVTGRKPRRKKPFAASLASRKHMESLGWTVAVVEQRIPHTFITRDAFGFGDLLCCSPTRQIMLVQATGGLSTSNFHARIAKIKAEPRAAIWLASGGRIQVQSWQGPRHDVLNVFEITKEPTI